MKRYRFILIGLLVALVVLGAGALYLRQAVLGTRTFAVSGRVAGFSDDGRTVFVEHEKIPGYMQAMTMPFTLRDTAGVSALSEGDAIRFRLSVRGDSAWIADLAPLPDSAVARHPAAQNEPLPTANASAPSEVLQTGDRVPDATLTAQSGQSFSLDDYRGQALVLTFIYTNCPLTNFCPLMSKRFAQLQPRLENAFGGRAQLLSISFDPRRDTPAVLRDYAARYTDDTDSWTFATGTPAQIEQLTTPFGVFARQSGGQIVHNLTTALIGPDGRLKKLWRGNGWTPGDVMKATRAALSASASSS